VLTGAPGEWVAAAELVAGGAADPGADRQPLLDAPARRALERRMREVAARVARARDDGDLAAQAAAEEELDALAAHVAAATGLGGRDRAFATSAERARTSVRKAVTRALAEIARRHPAAAAHLEARVTTGTTCRYEP